MRYVALLRGVNVGGKNKISMAELRICLQKLGFNEVSTFLNSGNALFSTSESDTKKLSKQIEEALTDNFTFESELIKVLVVSQKDLKEVIEQMPKGFAGEPEKYYSDIIFLIDISAEAAFSETECHPEVDKAWQGKNVIYYQRLGEKRTKSRLTKIIGKPIYKSMTIRTFNTVKKLFEQM